MLLQIPQSTWMCLDQILFDGSMFFSRFNSKRLDTCYHKEVQLVLFGLQHLARTTSRKAQHALSDLAFDIQLTDATTPEMWKKT